MGCEERLRRADQLGPATVRQRKPTVLTLFAIGNGPDRSTQRTFGRVGSLRFEEVVESDQLARVWASNWGSVTTHHQGAHSEPSRHAGTQ